MYEELIESLREKASRLYYDGWTETPDMIMQAANAIEHLELEVAALQTEAGGNVMAEYIDRDKSIKAVSGWYGKALHPENMSSYNEGERAAYRTALREIANLPAADVRPVITCGKCKHWFENGTDYCSCDRDALLRERDFFCAAGEKREES